MNDLASVPLLRAIGWALLHSLWQGAFLALLAAGALRWARFRSAELRYAIATGTLLGLVLVVAGTLAWLSGSSGPELMADPLPVIAPQEGLSGPGWLFRLRIALAPLLPWLFLAWVLGFTFRLAQLARSMAWLYGPCLDSLEAPPPAWSARLDGLRLRSGVRVPVRLGISRQVDSLVVLGWLKPVVLIPAAALLALPPESLEALLAHELAHVRRGDFFANVLQTFAEALLFYHPAVWWLSRRIRLEREHCCDDAAVDACGDPILYASALAGLEELRTRPMPVPDLAPAASGGHLMSRIQRLLRPPSTTGDLAVPLTALLPALLLVSALGVATLSASSATGGSAKEGPVAVAFSKVRVKHQPDPPAYPPEAKAARIQGTVVVRLTIGPDGRVTEAKGISGPPELQPCAIDYARAWEFEPVTVKGKAVAARFKLTMPFRLR